MASQLPRLLTMAIQRFDRTDALHTRAITVEQVLIAHAPSMTCANGLLAGTFDIAEMPLAYYLFLKAQGAPLTALPVFTDRIFLQQYAYTRPDTGITSLGDLAGRRVAVPRYFITAALWYRNSLKEAFGIDAKDIQWVTTQPETDPRMHIPEGVSVTVSPGPYLGLEKLLDGTVDCLLTEATPIVPPLQQDRVVRVYPNIHHTLSEYFRETGVHPIVHLIVLRQPVARERPGLASDLCEAFDRAKLSAYRLLQNERTTSLPLMRAYLDETIALFGSDPWPYGLQGRNRTELETLLDLAYDQGLTGRRIDVEDLFEPSVRDFSFRAEARPGADLSSAESLLGHLGPSS